MNLEAEQLYLLQQAAISAAYQTSRIIMEGFHGNVVTEHKQGGESLASQVVTVIDRRSQDLILSVLEPTIKMFDLGLLTEESVDDNSRLKKDFFWCIDPLDGTLPFIEKMNGFCISIALVSKQGEPFIGVVLDPVTQTLYTAVKGQGAYRNGDSLNVNSAPDSSFSFSMDRSFKDMPRAEEVLTEVEELSKKYNSNLETFNHRGSVMNGCFITERKHACFFKFPKKKDGGGSYWDFASSACIVKEAGGLVTDVFGNPFKLNNPESTFMNRYGAIYATSQEIYDDVRAVVELFYEG